MAYMTGSRVGQFVVPRGCSSAALGGRAGRSKVLRRGRGAGVPHATLGNSMVCTLNLNDGNRWLRAHLLNARRAPLRPWRPPFQVAEPHATFASRPR